MMRMRQIGLSGERIARHHFTNLLHTGCIFLTILAIFFVFGLLFFGWPGVVVFALGGGLSVVISVRFAPQILLRMYRAQPVTPRVAPGLFALVQTLSDRAGLRVAPRLFCIPSQIQNAFAVGHGRHACVAITHGMLRFLSDRELAGVLAHEISHIRNGDTFVLSLADAMSRLVTILAQIGFLLLLLNLPLILVGETPFPWLLLILINLAPGFVALLQLALSRTREFAADLDAARNTGDPRGLASALARLERAQCGLWERIFAGTSRVPESSLLRTHPPTDERVKRLLDLEAPPPPVLWTDPTPLMISDWTTLRPPRRAPHRHMTGLWF